MGRRFLALVLDELLYFYYEADCEFTDILSIDPGIQLSIIHNAYQICVV